MSIKPATCLFVAVALLSLGACSGYTILTEPDLALSKLPAPPPNPLLAVAVLDGEATERGAGYATEFSDAIRMAYGSAVKIVPASAPPATGWPTVTIRIVELGAFFNRHQDGGAPVSPIVSGVSGNVADWARVVAAATPRGALVSGRRFVYLPGNWNGIAHIEIEVRDLRPGRSASFKLPLMAERGAPNTGGYFTAKSTAADAWDEVRPELAAFLDAAVGKVIREQAAPPPRQGG